MRKALPLLALAALAGCGGYRSVRVKHKLPGAEAASSPALGAVYLVIKAPSAPGNQEVTALAGALLGKAGAEINYQALARRVSMVMKKEGAHLCAWRVEKGTGEVSDFADRLNPTGLVVLSLGAPSVSVTKQERTAVQYDKKNQKQTVRNKVWAYSASLPAEVQLLSWPDKKPLDSWAYAFEISEDRFDKSKAGEDWYSDSEGRLYSEVADKLAGRYAARTVERWRPLFSVAKDTGSEKAADLGCEGRWEEASAIWQSRLPAGGWRDQLGLAVAAESGKDYPAAEEAYKRAQELAGADKEARKVDWRGILRDLEMERSLPAPAKCDRSWFEEKTALLPFSDETTSIDGPPLARQLVFAQLKEAGYALLGLEDIDEKLRRRGYSDGAQLAAVNPADLAAWLGAGRLLYGDITDYGEIMAGVYNRRMVKGTLKLWEDREEGLEFEESVVRIKTPKSLVGGLAGQLAKGLVERIRNKPLAYEAGIFSRQAAENLPAAVK